MTAEGGLDIRLLGPVEVRRDGAPVQLGGRRQRALLALLAIQPGLARSVDGLAEELWAGEPPDGATISLRSYVTRLRRSLSDERAIVNRDGGYALDLPARSIDAVRFQELIHDAEGALAERRLRPARSRLHEALALWRDVPFGDVASLPALEIEATRLEELRLHALEQRLELDLELEDPAALVDELEALTQRHPHRERLWRHLMLALYRADRQADALAAYHRARARLDEELGIDPGQELQALEAAILRHEVPAASPPEERHNLPTPVSSFIGRDSELREISELLRAGRLVTVSGVGGVGKTRVGLEIARRLVAEIPDGVWFVELAPLSDPTLIARQVAAALGIAERPGTNAADQVVEHIRQLELLLVLDNCEHLRAASAELVGRILASAARVRVLATSREALAVPGEIEYPLQPLAVPESIDPERAGGAEAVRLFVARAREARPNFALQPANAAAVIKICLDLDGLPLGIELAAAKVRTLSPSEIASRLDDRMRFLVSWRRLAPARHRTLREAMDWSYDLLRPEEQALLASLSVFSGSFTFEAAANVGLRGDREQALAVLEHLVEASLVAAQPDAEETRYRLLETVRQYAAAQIRDAAELASLADRHASYYATLAARWHGQVQALGSQVLNRLTPDEANLRAALQRLTEQGRASDALRMAASMWRLWWLRGSISEGRARLREALARAPERSPERAEALRGASTLALRQLDLADAIALAEEGLAIASTHSDISGARAMVALANALGSRGELDRAERLYAEAASRFRTDGYPWELANCLMNMVDLGLNRGDLHAAEELATESLTLSRRINDKVGTLINLANLGFAALDRDDLDGAASLFDEALGLAIDVDYREFAAIVLVGVSAVASGRGDDTRAAMLLGAAERGLDDAGASLDSIERRWHDRVEAVLSDRMESAAFADTRVAGRGLGFADALRLGHTTGEWETASPA